MAYYEEESWTCEADLSFSDDAESIDSDFTEEDSQIGYEVKWPGARVARPPVSFLVKHRPVIPTRPPQIDATIYARFEKHMENVKGFREKKEEIQAKIEAKSSELLKAEAKPKTYGNKWSDKAKGQDAEVSRLTKELEVLQKSLHDATSALSKVDGSNEAVIAYVNGHRNLVKLYEEGVKAQHEGWDKVYGKHTPIKSLDQLKRYYHITSITPGLEEGTILIKFADDMVVGQAYRELSLGGHEYINRRSWDSLEIFGSE